MGLDVVAAVVAATVFVISAVFVVAVGVPVVAAVVFVEEAGDDWLMPGISSRPCGLSACDEREASEDFFREFRRIFGFEVIVADAAIVVVAAIVATPAVVTAVVGVVEA